MELEVHGMTCGHCEKAVRQAIQQLDPQAQVTIAREQHHVSVQTTLPRERVVQAIVDEGYEVKA